ncbi:hypothetical protein JTB14_011860 [Gonioctena quinquepunctata]|nr:hypothetical protein JTB14_011860 [Gonioctena quinquepunctata]
MLPEHMSFDGLFEFTVDIFLDMNYEDEQESLRRQWKKVEIDKEPNVNEDELAGEIDYLKKGILIANQIGTVMKKTISKKS